MKKIIYIVIMVVVLLSIVLYVVFNNKSKVSNSSLNSDKKILVVYYSAQGHTDKVSHYILNNLDADVFQVEPINDYSSSDLNYNDRNSRVYKEYSDESLRDIPLKNTNVDNWSDYDIVFIGYPIWWGVAAWPINNFVKNNNFDGKTVIPFCTSASSGVGDSVNRLKSYGNTGNWLDGYRFSSNASNDDVKDWLEELKNKNVI